VLRTLDSKDLENTKTSGILVNTYHLYREVGKNIIKNHNGVKNFMNWHGSVISDSGGFQVMSIVKKTKTGSITDKGVIFKTSQNKKIMFTPEKSIAYQMLLGGDMAVVLDDFTDIGATKEVARDTVERTILWAKRSKDEFERQCEIRKLDDKTRPLLLGVVQGGEYLDLRKECAARLAKIGFDGFGYGGWPMDAEGQFNYEVAQIIADNTPEDYLLYGLGVGKPQEIVGLVNMGYDIFDCVLPTRDARHGRLYVYNADSINEIDVHQPDFYSYYVPTKEMHLKSTEPVSKACDCLLCSNYSRSYFAHLFRIKEITALRLATIHNLRFYSLLMEKLRER